MKTHPPGLYMLRWCTVTSQLPGSALLEFAAARGLPSGFGQPVEAPKLQVVSPAGAESEYSGGQVTVDAPGLYHVPVLMLEEGEWVWEGQGWEAGQLVTSTGRVPWPIGPAIKT